VARRRRPEPTAPDGSIPDPLLTRTHPLWKDPDKVRAAFPEYVNAADLSGLRRHDLHSRVMGRWAIANGYESEQWPGSPDWHRLRAAGVGGPPDRPGDTAEESRLARVAWHDDLSARWQQDQPPSPPRPSRRGPPTST